MFPKIDLKTPNKKIFVHKKEFDKYKITIPIESLKYDEDFYRIDRERLLDIEPFHKRTSRYLFPSENIPDYFLLQTVIKTISSLTRYITLKPTNVKFTEVEGENHATYKGDALTVSISSLFDHRIPFHMRIDCIIALAIHEALHIRYTTPGMMKKLLDKGLTKKEVDRIGLLKTVADFDKIKEVILNQLHGMLINIVEDRRIESIGLNYHNGYVFYFNELRKYCIWVNMNEYQNNEELQDYSKPEKYWGALTSYIGLKVLMPELLSEFEKIRPKDTQFDDLMSKANHIVKDKALTFDDTMRQADALLKLYPEEQQKAQGRGIMIGVPIELSEEMKEQLQQMVQEIMGEQVKVETKVIKAIQHKCTYDKIMTYPAPYAMINHSIYKEALDISKSVARNLSFLDSRFNRTQESFELNCGNLDEEEIYSLTFNKNIFWEEEEAPGYNLDFAVLIDESGSMGGGSKIRQAQTAALALAIALQKNEYINLFVYGHTANENGEEPITMYRYLDPVEKARDINTLFSVEARSNNADGYAIWHMGEILKTGRSKNKVLVVISDGYPNAYGYDGYQAIEHCRSMVHRLEIEGIFVIQIAVECINSDKMFQHYIPFNSQDLGKNLRTVLLKKLVEISNLV